MGQANWDRIHDPANPMRVLIAADGTDTAKGFILYLTFPFSWSRGDACYLQDLFVTEDMRGRGIARSLIEALESLGRERGWYKIFWMTQAHNTSAQRLYDRVGIRRDYVRYDLPISEP
jgi:GNAT superfamily N-acetyltransferase